MPAPRILIVSKTGLLTWQHSIRAAFAELGLETRLFSASPCRLPEYIERKRSGEKQLFNKIIGRRLRSAVARFQPDLLFALYDLFPRDIVRGLCNRQNHRPQLAVWLCDCPLPVFDAQRYEPLDAFFAFDSSLRAPAAAFVRNPRQIVPLPLAFDLRQYHPMPCLEKERTILFAGTCSEERRQLVDGLRAQDVPVTALGNDWPRRFFNFRQRTLTHAQLNRHFNSSAIVLNHQQRTTIHGLNLRVFEATGAGAFLLTPNVPDLAACFEPGREVAPYHSPEELAELAQRGLKDTGWAQRIAAAGCRRARAEHTFAHRARTIAHHFGWI